MPRIGCDDDDLLKLPNLGKTLAARLEEAGIRNLEYLTAVGSIGAILKIRGHRGSGCYNMLYALEGAIRRCRWHSIPPNERAALRDEFERAVNDLGEKQLKENT